MERFNSILYDKSEPGNKQRTNHSLKKHNEPKKKEQWKQNIAQIHWPEHQYIPVFKEYN